LPESLVEAIEEKMGSERQTVAFGIGHGNMRTIVGEKSKEEKIVLAS
jgi:hypothetical protein